MAPDVKSVIVRRIVSALVLCGAGVTFATSAHASPAAAEALFQEGRKLLEEGRTDEACPKFAASYEEEASSGTLLNLAYCHELQGKTATAWAEYRGAASLARAQGRRERAETAESRAESLEPRLARVTLAVKNAEPGLVLTMDGAVVNQASLDVGIPVDPGTHRVTASRAGQKEWSVSLELREGEQRIVEVPALEPERSQSPAPAVAASPNVTAKSAPPASNGSTPRPTPGPVSETRGRPMAGWVALAGGGVLLAVGSAFGVSSLSAYRSADNACPTHRECSDTAMADREKAQRNGWIASVAIGLGIVGVGVGGYFLLSDPGPASNAFAVRAEVSDSSASIRFVERF